MEEGTVQTASEPPPLPYSLHTRKKSIALFWTIFVIDTLAQPLILYWCLWYLTDLSHNVGMFCMVEHIHPVLVANVDVQSSRSSPPHLEESRSLSTFTAFIIYSAKTRALDP
jgi:hypothetical protein